MPCGRCHGDLGPAIVWDLDGTSLRLRHCPACDACCWFRDGQPIPLAEALQDLSRWSHLHYDELRTTAVDTDAPLAAPLDLRLDAREQGWVSLVDGPRNQRTAAIGPFRRSAATTSL